MVSDEHPCILALKMPVTQLQVGAVPRGVGPPCPEVRRAVVRDWMHANSGFQPDGEPVPSVKTRNFLVQFNQCLAAEKCNE